MKLKVISGGQHGVDIAALFAARAAGLETGGWAPKGWQTETGPMPSLKRFGLVECPEPGYPARTRRNVADAHATLILADASDHSQLTGGTRLTWDIAFRQGKCGAGLYLVDLRRDMAADCVAWLRECIGDRAAFALNVAGPRESKAPGIGERAERFLSAVFRLLKEDAL